MRILACVESQLAAFGGLGLWLLDQSACSWSGQVECTSGVIL
jgi:hypothetical protein